MPDPAQLFQFAVGLLGPTRSVLAHAVVALIIIISLSQQIVFQRNILQRFFYLENLADHTYLWTIPVQ